jgi:hypothetical protein
VSCVKVFPDAWLSKTSLPMQMFACLLGRPFNGIENGERGERSADSGRLGRSCARADGRPALACVF